MPRIECVYSYASVFRVAGVKSKQTQDKEVSLVEVIGGDMKLSFCKLNLLPAFISAPCAYTAPSSQKRVQEPLKMELRWLCVRTSITFLYCLRVLVHRARKLAQQYYLVYQEPIPTAQLVQRVASVMQEYTQSG